MLGIPELKVAQDKLPREFWRGFFARSKRHWQSFLPCLEVLFYLSNLCMADNVGLGVLAMKILVSFDGVYVFHSFCQDLH